MLETLTAAVFANLCLTFILPFFFMNCQKMPIRCSGTYIIIASRHTKKYLET